MFPYPQGDVDALLTELNGLKEEVQRNISVAEDLMDEMQEQRTIVKDQLDKGKTGQKVQINQKPAEKINLS